MKTQKVWIKKIVALLIAVALVIPEFYSLPSSAAEETTTSLSIDTGPAVLVTGTTNKYKFPELVVNAPASTPVKSVTVQFTSAIQASDTITATAASGFNILSGSKAGNVSINATNKTAEQWSEYLRANITISLSSSNVLRKIRFNASATAATAIYDYNAENGHYYLAVNSKVNWTVARDRAAATSYLGMQGYLATVTSKSEQNFLTSLIRMNTWLGGTCNPSYLTGLTLTQGTTGNAISSLYNGSQARYFWATGPEAGQAYWYGNYKTRGYSYMYTNWASNEPNNYGGEYCTHMWGESNTIGTWNDYYNHNPCAYIIEFGGMPNDKPIWEVSSEDSSVVEINLDPTGKTLSTNVQADSITVGEDIVVSDRVNGTPIQEILDRDYAGQNLEVQHTFYKKAENGSWVELTEAPVHPGEYKVTSTLAGFTGDEDTFTITAKELTIKEYSKVYDGGTGLPSAVSLEGVLDDFSNIRLVYESAEYNSKNVAEATTVTLKGVKLEGENAIDYTLKGLEEDGTFILPATITPKPLKVRPSFEVSESWQKIALPYEYKHNIVEYSDNTETTQSGDNMLAYGDSLDTTLGTPVFPASLMKPSLTENIHWPVITY